MTGRLPERGEVVGLVDGALVDRAVAHEGHAGALQALVLEPVGEAGAERHLAADDAVAAPVVAGGVEEMHRAALALGAAGHLAVELRHERVQLHADRDGVAVVAVGGDDVVVLAHQRAAADGHRLLADVEMQEAADLLGLVGAQAALLEPADAHHHAVQGDLLLGRQRRVDGRGREARLAGAGLGFGFRRWRWVSCSR